MKRRSFLAIGISSGLAGCSAIQEYRTETVVDKAFQSTYRQDIQVNSGQVLRVEATPLSPEYQLYLIFGKSENLDDEASLIDVFSRMEEVESEVVEEVSVSEDTQYLIGVGWLEDQKDLSTDQYHLRVTIEG